MIPTNNNCILYCPREFPNSEVLSSLYLYYDNIIVVPPAQTIFTTHYLGNEFSIDVGLDQSHDLARIAEEYNGDSIDFKKRMIIQDYDINRTKLINQITLEAWQYFKLNNSLSKKDISDLYNLRDSIVSSIFSYANRNLMIKRSDHSTIKNSNPEIEFAFQLTMNDFPSIISNDLDLLKEIKIEMKDSIESFKDFIRNERFKFLNIYSKMGVISDELKGEFNQHIKYEIEKLKSSFDTKIRIIHQEKEEIKFGIFGSIIKGIAIGLVSNPALGAISGLFDAHSFGQKWITLKNQERIEIQKAEKSEIGIFLKFDEIKKQSNKE